MAGRSFYIIGAGPGNSSFLTLEAKQHIDKAQLVLATSERLGQLSKHAVFCPYHSIINAVEASGAETVAVLVSGDVGFYSLARTLAPKLWALGKVHCVAGISSLQYFCARIGISYDDALCISLHGRNAGLLGAVSYHGKVLLLTDDRNNASAIAQMLCKAGFINLKMTVGEALGSENERMQAGEIEEFAHLSFSPLSVVLIENPAPAAYHLPLFDTQMLRDAVPMTKETVRWTSVAKLKIQPHDVVWDIGAGSGSVSIEMARHAHRGLVYAVEEKPLAIELLDENRKQLGSYNIIPVQSEAPEALDTLPMPDAVFIGGSRGKLGEIIAVSKAKNPKVRMVINAVTLETLHLARAEMQMQGFENIDIIQLAVTRTKAVGNRTMLQAENPVFVLSGEGKDGS